MSEFLRDVDEALKQDRMIKLWNDYGGYLITIIMAIIVFTALYSGYDYWVRQQKIADTKEVMATLNSDDFPANVSPETLNVDGNIAALTMLTAANQYETLQRPDDAKTLYESVSQNKSISSELRSVAQIALARLDGDNAQELQNVINASNSPWRFLAKLHLAGLETTSKEDALKHLDDVLANPDLPPGIYAKARSLKHITELRTQESQETGAEE